MDEYNKTRYDVILVIYLYLLIVGGVWPYKGCTAHMYNLNNHELKLCDGKIEKTSNYYSYTNTQTRVF